MSRSRSRAVAAAFFILAVTVCRPNARPDAGVRERTIEPRLAGFHGWRPCKRFLPDGHVVEDASCGAAERRDGPPTTGMNCGSAARGHEQAVALLVSDPECIDSAIDSLTKFAATKNPDVRVLNDLAAAHYLRAQRHDNPEDLLRAFDGARQAVARDPARAEARFNLALIEEALGLTDAAIESWIEVARRDSGPWAAEASGHRTRLERERAASAVFPLRGDDRVLEAMRAGDRASVRQFAAASPEQVRFLVERLIRDWAAAAYGGEQEDAQRLLRTARTIAVDLASVTGDRFLFDAIEQIAAAAPAAGVLQGVRAYAEGRQQQTRNDVTSAQRLFENAELLLRRAGSPLVHDIAVRRATLAYYLDSEADLAGQMVATAEYARVRRYTDLWARAQLLRADVLSSQGRWAEALEAYADIATNLETAARVHAASARVARAKVLRTIGHGGEAWRDTYSALRHLRHVDWRLRPVMLEETAAASLALGYPHAALHYQNSSIRLLENDLSIDASPVDYGRTRLAAALAGRTAIQLSLGRVDEAERDLREAERLTATADVSRFLLLARIRELQGQMLLVRDPARAEASFTEAVDIALRGGGEYPSYTASLLAQRAAVRRTRGNEAGAAEDWQHAVAAIEAAHRLEAQGHPQRAVLWNSYFSSFDDTYHRLSVHLVESGRAEDAFGYAERARLIAPENLIYERLTAAKRPPSIAGAANLEQLRRLLPHETTLLEYLVLSDRTIVWIVSRDFTDCLVLRTGRAEVNRWAQRLLETANLREDDNLTSELTAAHAGLLAEPLRRIRERHYATRRLVLIPDTTMSGIPFAALQDQSTGRYVIEDYTVSVAGSATQYIASLQRDAQLQRVSPPPIHALVFGDPLHDLPGAAYEATGVGRLYGASVVHIGADATVDSFLRFTGRSAILHLAVPVVNNERMPSKSLLRFAADKGQSGTLSAEDLLTRMELQQTRLVVLSGCCLGASGSSAGLGALETTFLAAGVPGVIGATAPVEDRSTMELMIGFHERYTRGNDAADALRDAQLALLRSEKRSSPRFWGTFRLIGAASPWRNQ